MPSGEEAEEHRVVLDESSLDFRGLSDHDIGEALDEFNENLLTLRTEHDQSVACPPMWDLVDCLDGVALYQFLSREHPSAVDRDTLLLTYRTLYNCPEWLPLDDAAVSVSVSGEAPIMALSVGYPLQRALAGRGVACLVFRDLGRNGFLEVATPDGKASVYFFADPTELRHFWRHVFSLEDVAESRFFEFGARAFPRLVLHPDLTFRHFDGAYRDIRDRVVVILGGLSDHFVREYQAGLGVSSVVQAAMGQYRVVLSPESPGTRGSERLMRLRDRTFEGRTYRCEWHAKIEPHRNRIHFSGPEASLGGRILIGIFVNHLDT